MEWSKYNYLYYSKTANSYLLYSSLSNAFIQLSKEGAEFVNDIIKDPESHDEDNDLIQVLKDKRFLVSSNRTEANKIIFQTLISRYNSKSLSLTIAPTQTCNFNCPYCYEANKTGGKMTTDVQKRLIQVIKDNKELKSIGVTWYGGEPTLAIPTIKRLSKELMKCVPNYSAYMITNGYLLDKIVDDLESLKIYGIQITLDGTKETHDKTRCLKNGEPSFERILENLDIIASKNYNVDVSIRMNISKDNGEGYVKLHKLIQSRYRGKRIRLYPAFVVDYTGCNSLCYVDNKSQGEFLKNLYYKHNIITSPLYPTRTNKGCMAQTMNAFVVGPDGELYKCWHHLGDKNKSVGNIMSPEIIQNHEVLANSMVDNDVIFDEKCIDCVLFPSCYGGCKDNKGIHAEYCIPAKSSLNDYLDIKYLQWKKINEKLH